MNPIADLNRFLIAIERAGLGDIAKSGSEYAFETSWRISSMNTALDNGWTDEEMLLAYEVDTMETARVLSNPDNWGMIDDRWKEFCKEWK